MTDDKKLFRVLSLGAGVQSTTLALMAAHGEFGEMPDCAVFADTGDEPEAVYKHLDWLKAQNLPFPIHTATYGIISDDLLAGSKEARPPLFMRYRQNKRLGMLPRQCTKNYKVRVINRKVRELCGIEPRKRPPKNMAEIWIGISMDEIMRMRPSKLAYMANRHPLIEKQMTRNDCLTWLETNKYPTPPKSACWHCPYQTNEQWLHKKNNWPEDWQKAVAFDKALRSESMVKLNNFPCYLHASGLPLDEVDLVSKENAKIDLFNNECEGMCGV